MERIFIGVAWPYTNGSLHLGHVAGSLLPADIFARYHRIKGNEVLMVSGSDEHGTPITIMAEKQNKKPIEIAEYYHNEHVDNLYRLGISFDIFSRTTDEQHEKVAQEFFMKLYEKGYIYKRSAEGYYCENCNRWLPDRYIKGACGFCGAEDTKGDQCENCGRALDINELKNPRCRICDLTPKIKQTEHFYFKLTEFQDRLLEYMKDKNNYWRENVYKYTLNLIKEIQDRPITRDIDWGVKIPIEGYVNKRIYVWFEALIGYLSASKKNKNFWYTKNAKHYYFIGKDNIPFHTVIWPSMLMAYGNLALPYDVPANEFLTSRGMQFSKSAGIGISLPECLKMFEQSAIRYYLSVNMPESKDIDCDIDDFIRKNNDELVATLGNFIYRVLTFSEKNFVFPKMKINKIELEKETIEMINNTFDTVEKSIENCHFRDGIKNIMGLAIFGNRFIQENEPWKLIKNDRDKCEAIMHIALRIVKALAVLIYPYLPSASEKLQYMIGYDYLLSWSEGKSAVSDIEFRNIEPLFKKIDVGIGK